MEAILKETYNKKAILYVRQLNDISNTITDIPIGISTNNHTVTTLLSSIQSALDTNFGANQMTVTYESRNYH